MVDTAAHDVQKTSRKFVRRRLLPCMLLVVAGALIVYGGLRFLDRHHATTGVAKPPDAQVVVTNDVREPAENKPEKPAEQAYAVPADQPRSIMIGAINASGLVQQVGLTKDNAVSTPTNIHFAGWYTGTVKPGQEGLSIIDGHVSGKYTDGIFKNLKKLKAGDAFVIEFGDKSTRGFNVVEVKTVPEKQAAALLFARKPDISKQLNLITCGGTFNTVEQKYEDRVIVVAKAQ